MGPFSPKCTMVSFNWDPQWVQTLSVRNKAMRKIIVLENLDLQPECNTGFS